MFKQTVSIMKTDNKFFSHLTSDRLLARNAFVNLAGQGAPMLIGFLAIPLLIKGLGPDRFGILTLAWVVVGYFSLFDLGLGRALTKLVAEYIGKGETQEIPGLIWTALSLMIGLGVIGMIVSILLTPWLVGNILKIPVLLQNETRMAFYLLGISLPVVIGTAGLRGVLEAHQRFNLINAVRVPMGFFTFLGPLMVLPFSKSLVLLISILILGRLVAWVVHLILCFRVIPSLRHQIHLKQSMIKPLISFGSWLTISNVIGPIMLYMDRFLIASMISVASVAYYTTPYEVIIKLLIIPSATLAVMFPAFTSSFSQGALQVTRLYHKTMRYVFLIMLPLIFLICLFSEQALTLWINSDFAHKSFRVAQLLALGVFVNSFGHISQSLVQASGRPDLTAKLHLVELPLYLIYLNRLVLKYGINGAASAWLIRVTISTLVLTFLASRSLKEKEEFNLKSYS